MCSHVFPTFVFASLLAVLRSHTSNSVMPVEHRFHSPRYQLRSTIHYLVPRNCHTCQNLLFPLLADVLPTGLCVVFQSLTYLRPAPIFTGIPWPAMWVVLPEIRF